MCQFCNPSSDYYVPAITGNMYVYNSSITAIEEDELTSKYKQYWPNLNIYAKHINEANVAKFV